MLGCCETAVRQHSTDCSHVQMSSHQSLLPLSCAPQTFIRHCHHQAAHHTQSTFDDTDVRQSFEISGQTCISQSLGTISEPFVCGGKWQVALGLKKNKMFWNGANFRCGSSGAWESRCAQPVRRKFCCGAKFLSVRWLSARPHSTKSNQHARDERNTTLHKDGHALRALYSADAVANELRLRPGAHHFVWKVPSLTLQPAKTLV